MAVKAAITSVGGYIPEYRLTNQILETMVDTTDEWITSRTGIKERRILKGSEEKGSWIVGLASQLVQPNYTQLVKYENL